MNRSSQLLALPPPNLDGAVSLERTLRTRRSIRSYTAAPLRLADVGQLLWAAQAITHDQRRSAPSAGALYPLELYVVSGRVQGLDTGIYRYVPAGHQLRYVTQGDYRHGLSLAALEQQWVEDAPAVLVITAVEARTTNKYGTRGLRYLHMEAGHAAQNMLLQAAAIGLGGVTVGAFDDAEVALHLQLPVEETPLILVSVGHPEL